MLVQSSKTDQLTPRANADREELAERIARALPGDGANEPRPGLQLHRQSTVGVRAYAFARPAVSIIAQGSKEIWLGPTRFRCDPAHYLITTMALPLASQVVSASPARPYLSCKLSLDPAVVTSVLVESGFVAARKGDTMLAVDVSPIDASLLDATLRLVRLIENPSEYRVLAPLVTREIVYRLWTGAQGHRMGHLVSGDGSAHMARAVEGIRENLAKPLRIETMARKLGMSVSGFHAHFKAATAMSPLQFQKRLRLEEARRLLLSEHADAAEAGYRVGYGDPSHFSRDYKRQFGDAPLRDVERIRAAARRPIIDCPGDPISSV
jgi:AraC-like DNA-binding protein